MGFLVKTGVDRDRAGDLGGWMEGEGERERERARERAGANEFEGDVHRSANCK